MHDLAACLGVEDPVEVDLAEVFLLGLQVAGFHDPQGQLGVQSAQMVSVGAATVIEAGREGGEREERESSLHIPPPEQSLAYLVSHFSSSSCDPHEAYTISLSVTILKQE